MSLEAPAHRALHTGCGTHSLASLGPTAPRATLQTPALCTPPLSGQGRQRGWGTVPENTPGQARHSPYHGSPGRDPGLSKRPQSEMQDKLTQDCEPVITYGNCIIASFPVKNIFIFRKYSKIFRGKDVVFAAYLK